MPTKPARAGRTKANAAHTRTQARNAHAPAVESPPLPVATDADTKLSAKPRSLYETVVAQFNKAADLMNLDEGVRRILGQTKSEIVINFPVK